MERAIRDALTRRIGTVLQGRPPGWAQVSTSVAALPPGWRMWRADPTSGCSTAIVLVVHDHADIIQLEARWSRLGPDGLLAPAPRWPGEDLLGGEAAAVRAQVVDPTIEGEHDLAAGPWSADERQRILARAMAAPSLEEWLAANPREAAIVAPAPLMTLDDAGPAIGPAVAWAAGVLDEVLLPYLDRVRVHPDGRPG
ncbi:MAG: hypothetical protein ABGZ36_02900 [Actinomycetota bacterium]